MSNPPTSFNLSQTDPMTLVEWAAKCTTLWHQRATQQGMEGFLITPAPSKFPQFPLAANTFEIASKLCSITKALVRIEAVVTKGENTLLTKEHFEILSKIQPRLLKLAGRVIVMTSSAMRKTTQEFREGLELVLAENPKAGGESGNSKSKHLESLRRLNLVQKSFAKLISDDRFPEISDLAKRLVSQASSASKAINMAAGEKFPTTIFKSTTLGSAQGKTLGFLLKLLKWLEINTLSPEGALVGRLQGASEEFSRQCQVHAAQSLLEQLTKGRLPIEVADSLSAELSQYCASRLEQSGKSREVPTLLALSEKQLGGMLENYRKREITSLPNNITSLLNEHHKLFLSRLLERFREGTSAGLSTEIALLLADHHTQIGGWEGPLARQHLWLNEPCQTAYTPDFSPHLVRLTERVVERFWVMNQIRPPEPGLRVIDVGCSESLLSLELASSGYTVFASDLRPYPYSHPNLTTYQGDVLTLEMKPEEFDILILLSTIEHVGVGYYGDNEGQSLDLTLMEKLRNSLKVGGQLLLTVPFGLKEEFPVHRIYDLTGLHELLVGFTLQKLEFGVRRDDLTWTRPATEECANSAKALTDGTPGAVALVSAIRSVNA